MKKFFLIFFLCFFVASPTFATFEAQSNVGFITAPIWYSKDPFSDGDAIKIYTVVFNGGDQTIRGSVEFYDKTTILGRQDFVVVPKNLKDVSIDWNVTAGDHSITAKIIDPEVVLPLGKTESVFIDHTETAASKRTVMKRILPKSTVPSDEVPVLKQVDALEKIITSHTPTVFTGAVGGVVGTIDTWRSTTGSTVQEKKDVAALALRKESAGTTASAASPSEKYVDTPIRYVTLFFLTLFSFILNTPILFYGLILLVVALIVRIIYKAIRHKMKKKKSSPPPAAR